MSCYQHCTTLVCFTERLIQRSHVGVLVRRRCRYIGLRTVHSPEQVLKVRGLIYLRSQVNNEKGWRAHRNISARPTTEHSQLFIIVTRRLTKSLQLRPRVTA
jgi:hypothetical protein